MKVNLAAQTISASVEDAIEFCDLVLEIPAFHDSAPTVKFIRIFDHLFDIFNSRNPYGKHYKSPLRESNKHAWQPFLTEAMQYISTLTDSCGTPMVKTKRKTGFLGFLVAIKSIECLFNELVRNTNVSMTYLLTYKQSRDHLELFFVAIRLSGGWNNNSTTTQFMAAYKRLLLRHEVSASGNCTALDATNILHAVKDTTTINHVNADIDVSDITTIRRYDLNVRLEP